MWSQNGDEVGDDPGGYEGREAMVRIYHMKTFFKNKTIKSN